MLTMLSRVLKHELVRNVVIFAVALAVLYGWGKLARQQDAQTDVTAEETAVATVTLEGDGMADWRVTGAGDNSYNGDYSEAGTFEGKPYYTYNSASGTRYLYWASDLARWALSDALASLPTDGYLGADAEEALPANPWGTNNGTPPAPTVSAALEEPPAADPATDGIVIAAPPMFCEQGLIEAIDADTLWCGLWPDTLMATAYLLDIPEAFKLTPKQDAELDSYLGQRFQGNFTMAGIQFWPEMERLDQELLEKIQRFDDVVVVFTNVIFDTSQVHANILFEDMFVWLRSIVDFARRHPQTLFVIRAHPDELRPGKESRETVQQHLEEAGAFELPNLEFLEPTRYVSSYELIQRAKYVMVYNSTIGLEATLLGKVVLCGGQARYTAYPTAYLPEDREGYFTLAERFLAEENPAPPQEFREHARRFTYYQHYHSSLDFSRFMVPHDHFPGYVRFRDFDPLDLHPSVCREATILVQGVKEGQAMIYPLSGLEGTGGLDAMREESQTIQ